MSMLAIWAEKQEEGSITIVRSSEFGAIIRYSELRTNYSELYLKTHGFHTDLGTRDDPRYGERLYGEEHQTRCGSL
jgi:hypothetical protein